MQKTIIKPKTGWFEINLKELWQYRDLIGLFVKRNFTAQYKQTILGPLWFIINPLLNTLMFTLIFGQIAGMSTDGVPGFCFYLVGTSLWQYFSTCLTSTSSTFTGNAGTFGKVYFPRLVVPIATVLFSLINFAVVFVMAIVTMIIYICNGAEIHLTWAAWLIPVFILQTALLGLGVGIIVSALTTKYRDLTVLVPVAVQLWMYATPVAYGLSQLSPKMKAVMVWNPMTPIINNFRYGLLGCGEFLTGYWVGSVFVTLLVLAAGVLLFNRVEKTFMDTV